MSEPRLPDRATSQTDEQELSTRLNSPYRDLLGSPTPPIYQTSLFTFDTYEEMLERFAERSDHPLYSRVDNPTVREFEQLMANAEGAERAAAFASGMAAISAALFAYVKPGERIASVRNVYPDAYRLFERLMRPLGIEVTYHDVGEFAANPDLLEGVKVAYLESPVSVTFEVVDLDQVVENARRHGTLTMIDNSWATPCFQKPLAHGIDMVLHSCSKYISGHSDTVAGVICGSQTAMEAITDISVPLLGGRLAALDAFLLIRGLRTLELRMERHNRSTEFIAAKLAAHPLVDRINLPRAGDIPSLTGHSGLFSIELSAQVEIARFCNALKLFNLGVSWGGFESLVLPISAGQAQKSERNALNEFGISPSLVRLNVGLEDAENLWADLEAALHQASTQT